MRKATGQYKFDVFVSYHEGDRVIVEKIARHLNKSGVRLWFDKWEIRNGQELESEIKKGLARSRVLLLFISPKSIGKSWARFESQTVLFRDPQNSDRRFVPILLEGENPPSAIESALCVRWEEKQVDQLLARLVAVCTPPPQPKSSKGRNVHRLTPKKQWQLPRSVSAVRLVGEDKVVVLGTTDGYLTWLNESGAVIRDFGHQGATKFVDWHKEKQFAVSSGTDRKTLIWSENATKRLHSYPATTRPITCTRVLGDWIVCGTKEGAVHIWTDTEEKVLRGHSSSVEAIDVKNELLLTASTDKTIRIWDAKTDRCIRVLEGHTESVRCLAVSPNGEWLLSGRP